MDEAKRPTRADVAVVGAGPAGMMAAIAAASGGAARPVVAANGAANHGTRRVIVVEQLERPGVKLLATGGGRCNLTHSLEAAGLVRRFGRGGPFVRHAITELDCEALREFFGGLGVETVCQDDGCVFPASQSAAAVQKALLAECRRLGVEFLLGAEAKEVLVENGVVRGLAIVEGATGKDEGVGTVESPRLILAAGGRGYPELGGTGGGYALARRAGHQIVEPSPALVDLKTKETWPTSCAGISVTGARVWVDLPAKALGGAKGQALARSVAREGVTGDVLFTHEGVSGPAILDISGDVVDLIRTMHEVPLRLAIWPGTTVQHWRSRLDGWRESHGRRSVAGLLALQMPARLAEAICAIASVGPQTTAAHLDSRQRQALAEELAALRLTAVGSGGFPKAMVTRGGVSLKEVEARTLESKLVKGLYFAGEVLDVDGPCGGFNLQWAFSSGRLAGLSAAR